MRIALAALALAGAGCGQLGGTVCALQGQSTYRIDFSPPFSAPGNYDVNLTLDGATGVCHVNLPGLVSLTSCPPLTPQIVQANGKMTNITFFGAPQKIDVSVVMNGATLATATFAPSFSKPNDCGQVSAASDTLTH